MKLSRRKSTPHKPHEDPAKYTADHAKAGLLYADCKLRNEPRNLSPIGEMALRVYKETCASLLQLERGEHDFTGDQINEAKAQWIATIRSFEQSLQYRENTIKFTLLYHRLAFASDSVSMTP